MMLVFFDNCLETCIPGAFKKKKNNQFSAESTLGALARHMSAVSKDHNFPLSRRQRSIMKRAQVLQSVTFSFQSPLGHLTLCLEMLNKH